VPQSRQTLHCKFWRAILQHGMVHFIEKEIETSLESDLGLAKKQLRPEKARQDQKTHEGKTQ
jgi:hypothetical protein